MSKIKIPKLVLSCILELPHWETLEDSNYEYFRAIEDEASLYTLIENNIISSDEYDGGSHYKVIIRSNDGKFYKLTYTDWDSDNNFEDNFPEELIEVFPKEITKIVYE